MALSNAAPVSVSAPAPAPGPVSRSPALLLSLAALALVALSACGDTRLKTVEALTVKIDTPTESQVFALEQALTLHAIADNPAGVAEVKLFAGAVQVGSCVGVGVSTHLECQAVFAPKEQQAQIQNNHLILKATAASTDASVDATVDVLVQATPISTLALSFVQPALTTQSPPVAAVGETGPLELATSGTATVAKIVITDERNHQFATFTSPPYSMIMNWSFALGMGAHTLSATATDTNGNEAIAQRVITIACTADTDCQAGNRCCFQDGQCHPIVAAGADCDCAHPCPLTQGCFPGTCGATPQKCRPGCNPGSNTPSRVPDTCANENGQVAYCSPLPKGQATPENHGGACAPADGCDVHTQNCPDLPLDRTQPVSATNPAVPHTCQPVSATRTSCFPAGTHPAQDNNPGNDCFNGAKTCGSAQAGCAKGLLCTGIVGLPQKGLACSKQCNDPVATSPFSTPPQSRDCDAGQYCAQLQGTGGQLVLTGICLKI